MDALGIALPVVFAVLGGVIGWAYFRILHFSVSKLAPGKTGLRQFALLGVLRLLLFSAGLAGAVYASRTVGKGATLSLVTYFLGFFIMRTVTVGRLKAEPEPRTESTEQ